MKKAFEILKDRPKLGIKLTRDSVCAGDDVDAPHEKTVNVHSFADPIVLTQELCSNYLPRVSGSGHFWTALLNGSTISIIMTDEIKPEVHALEFEEENHGHFQYHSSSW
jgi:hypothetical protein